MNIWMRFLASFWHLQYPATFAPDNVIATATIKSHCGEVSAVKAKKIQMSGVIYSAVQKMTASVGCTTTLSCEACIADSMSAHRAGLVAVCTGVGEQRA
jgi:hypothetical protein